MAKKNVMRAGLIGAETLLGGEIKQVCSERVPELAISEFAATAEGNFGESEGEAVYVEALTAETVAELQALVLAGTVEGAEKAWALAQTAKNAPLVIDCTGQLEAQPAAQIVAAQVARKSRLAVIPHAASMALFEVLSRLQSRAAIRRSVANIFEPASERGKRGLSELHQQTTALLAFKPLDKNVFDDQLSFNLLSRYGEEAPTTLISVEQRVERNLASLLSNTGAAAAMPSLRVVQAPVFHGHSISLWVELEQRVPPEEVAAALASDVIDVRGADLEPPTNVGSAGQSGILVGDIRPDANNANAIWLWITADNLRVIADAAAALLRTAE